jgi:hypothetical protein
MNLFVLLLIGGVGLVQLPMLVDIIVVALPSARLRRLTQRSLSIVLISVVLLLAASALGAFFTVYLPHTTAGNDTLYAIHAACISYLWLLMLDNYVHAATIRPSKEAIARRQVPAFDHFCPFTMNHVWRDNFAMFYVFLAAAALGTLYASLVSWSHFHTHWISPFLQDDNGGLEEAPDVPPLPASASSSSSLAGVSPDVSQSMSQGVSQGVSQSVSLLFVAAFGLLQATGGLLLFQTYLLCRGWSTVTFFNVLRAEGGPRVLVARCLGLVPFDDKAEDTPEGDEKEAEGRREGRGEGDDTAAEEKAESKWRLLTQRPLWSYLLPPTAVYAYRHLTAIKKD